VPRWQRALLPGGLHDSGEDRRSVRDWLVDVATSVVALGIGLLLLDATWSDHSGFEVGLDIAAGVVAWLVLWRRRSHPVAVGLMTGAAAVVSALAAGAAVVGLFNAAIRAPTRALAAVVALNLVGTAILPVLYPGQDPYGMQVLVGTLLTGVVVGWGLFVRVQRQLLRSLRDRATRVESEQRLRLEQAREAERRRIAREMHDVLAHRVSLLSLHAGALEFRSDAPAEEVAEAAAVIRANAHAALAELREVIGVLREGDERHVPEPPQPTLADIPELVEQSRAGGMRVTLRTDALASDTPPALGRTVYRVVQEGLTNARKHAPGAAVEVTITRAAGAQLVVAVVSRPAVGVGAGAAVPGSGTGLVGLAERVSLAGGQLGHGPDASGNFVLRASLPLTA
jgi:signal transduction histidine kinase